MHKSATKCNKTLSKWCKNKHGASKIIDTFETYQPDPCIFEVGHLGFFMSSYVRRKAQLRPVLATPTRVDENPYLSSSYTPTQPSLGLGFCLD
jgi:hypothetical protein